MSEILFGVAVLAVIVIFILTLVQVVKADFEFWPPPNATSWQHTTFRMLFRVYFVCLVVLSFLEFGSSGPWATALGGTLLIVAALIAGLSLSAAFRVLRLALGELKQANDECEPHPSALSQTGLH